MNGWIILDKPLGMGSTTAVAAIKRLLREGGYGKVKIGHGGTLDPLATGVLPIALGEATKLAGRMLDASKSYDFTIAFGSETDGLDAEGAVVATSTVRPKPAQVAAVLARFTGPIDQVPPAYSAIKVDGKRAYARARAGEEVVLAPRRVTVHALDLRSIPTGTPEQPLAAATLSAQVSKGTYIRSLARDIARAAGTVGHVTMLRRTRAGPFTLAQAISLDKIQEIAKRAVSEEILLPFEAGLADIPVLDLSPEMAAAVRTGRRLVGVTAHDGLYGAWDAGVPVALVQITGGRLTVTRGFNL